MEYLKECEMSCVNRYVYLLDTLPIGIVRLLCFTLLIIGSALEAQTTAPFFRSVKAEIMISRPAKTKGGDYDDQMQTMEPRIKLTNMDARQNYEGYKASFLLLGESTVDGKIFKVLQRHDFPVNLPARQILDKETPSVTTRYDTTDAKFGFKYDGWIFFVTDPTGAVAMVKSTSPALEKMPTQLESLKQEGCYTRQFKPVPEPRLKR